MPRALANINSDTYIAHCTTLQPAYEPRNLDHNGHNGHNANPAVIERFITAQILGATCSAQPDSERFELSLGPNSRGLGQILSYFAGYHPGRRMSSIEIQSAYL